MIAQSSAMADTIEPTENCLEAHVAIRLKDCVLVLSKTSYHGNSLSHSRFCYAIWMYSLWTEQWRENTISKQKELPEVNGQTGMEIGNYVYIFGGINSGMDVLWKLIRNANSSFVFGVINAEDQRKVPSPRIYHCAWEHAEKMWIWGGYGPPTADYLNDHGNFIPWPSSYGVNNQLFSYDSSANIWTNAECFGNIPSPRWMASAAKIQDSVWLYGGISENSNRHNNDFYELNIHSFGWTKIESTIPRAKGRKKASLTSISASQLVLYGGYNGNHRDKNLRVPWIFDVQSHTWRQHFTTETHHRWGHTGITGLNRRAIILGGKITPCEGSQQQKDIMISVVMEPMKLQQLAIQIIYIHSSKLPWENLPKKLICKIMGPK